MASSCQERYIVICPAETSTYLRVAVPDHDPAQNEICVRGALTGEMIHVGDLPSVEAHRYRPQLVGHRRPEKWSLVKALDMDEEGQEMALFKKRW